MSHNRVQNGRAEDLDLSIITIITVMMSSVTIEDRSAVLVVTHLT